MFIIRTAFWLSLVILCLPVGKSNDNDVASVGTAEAFFAAQATYGDLSRFCERNASACDTGGQVISAFGQKARYGAQVVYEFLDEKFGGDQKAELDNTKDAKES